MPRTVNVLENSLYTKNKAHFWTRKSYHFFAISVNRRYTLYEHESNKCNSIFRKKTIYKVNDPFYVDDYPFETGFSETVYHISYLLLVQSCVHYPLFYISSLCVLCWYVLLMYYLMNLLLMCYYYTQVRWFLFLMQSITLRLGDDHHVFVILWFHIETLCYL